MAFASNAQTPDCCPGCERISNGDFENPNTTNSEYDDGTTSTDTGDPFGLGEVSCWGASQATPHIWPINVDPSLNHFAVLFADIETDGNGLVSYNVESSIYSQALSLSSNQYYRINFKYYTYKHDSNDFPVTAEFVFTNNSNFQPGYTFGQLVVDYDVIDPSSIIQFPFSESSSQSVVWYSATTDCFLYNGETNLHIYPITPTPGYPLMNYKGLLFIDDIEFELCPQYEVTHTCEDPVTYQVEIIGNTNDMTSTWITNSAPFANVIANNNVVSFNLNPVQAWNLWVQIEEEACNLDICSTWLMTEGNAYIPINVVSSLTDVSCYGWNNGGIDLTISGAIAPYTFEWSNQETTEDITGLSAGSFSVTITDFTGCEYFENYTVNEPPEIEINSLINNVSCFGASDGSIDISAAGGVSPYTFLWSNSSITEDLINIPADLYYLTVTDAIGCTETISSTVEEPAELFINEVITNPTCFGGNDGSIDLTLTGGTPTFTFLWDNSSVF